MKNVLVIDDSKQVRFFLSRIFEDQGFNVITAENGQLGIKEFEKNNFDIVLSDIDMPIMNGIEVAQYVFDNYQTRITLITGTQIKDLPQEYFYSPGVKNILHKSHFTENVVPIINKLVKNEAPNFDVLQQRLSNN